MKFVKRIKELGAILIIILSIRILERGRLRGEPTRGGAGECGVGKAIFANVAP
jgi:hypothetical protein